MIDDIVKTYPCLYDTKSADFKVNLKKENSWKAISNALARPGELKQCHVNTAQDFYHSTIYCIYSGGCATALEGTEG